MFRDTLIIVVVLLLLITIVSAFGGSVRHTPSMSPEGFYGYNESFQDAEGDEDDPAGGVEGDVDISPPDDSDETENAEAAATAAMAAAGIRADDAEPPITSMGDGDGDGDGGGSMDASASVLPPIGSGDGVSGGKANPSIEAFEGSGAYASW